MNERENNQYRFEADLINRIKGERYTDLEEKKILCKRLLEVAEPEQHIYSSAFANVYLFDCHLTLGDFDSSGFYFARALSLCRKCRYDDLMLVLCSCAGRYYQKLGEEKEALKYSLEGLRLTKSLGDYEMESQILDNIGTGFAVREDWQTACDYFERAFHTLEPYMGGTNCVYAINYLSNAAKMYIKLSDARSARAALSRCEEMGTDGMYNRYRLDGSWCSYYAMTGEWERCAQVSDSILDNGLLAYDNRLFVYDMLEGLCSNMLDIGQKGRALKLLGYLEELGKDVPLASRYSTHIIRTRFLEQYGTAEELNGAYEKYYDIMARMMAVDDQTRAQSMVSKIQLTNALMEREAMFVKNQELETVGQMDELTGLYNRRYFNKLVSKAAAEKDVNCLGFIMLDVDYFKQYNDYYGHFMGDNTLRAVSAALSEWSSENIHVSRYGGDEFVCLCVNQTNEQMESYIENVRNSLREKGILHEKSCCSSFVTLSIGYSNEWFTPGTSPDFLIKLADQALYAAKEGGRDRKAVIKP